MKAGVAAVEITPKPGTHLAGDVGSYRPAQCVPLVLNGCCGNINPWPAFDVDFRPDHRRMGRAFGDMGEKVLRALKFADEAALDWRTQAVPLRVRQVDAKELQEAETYLSHYTNDYLAYLPTRAAYERGGHEVFFCQVQAGSLEMVVERATGLLRELFA